VLELEKLQTEVSAPPGIPMGFPRRAWRVVGFFICVIGGLFLAMVLSVLLSHPAGAAALPGLNGGAPDQPSNLAQTVVSEVAPGPTSESVGEVIPLVPSVVNAVRPIETTSDSLGSANLHLARQVLHPVIGLVLQSVAPSLNPVVATLTPVGRPVSGRAFTTTPLPTPLSVSPPASTQPSLSGSVARDLAFHSAPTAPMHQPSPIDPVPQVPVNPSGSTSDTSLPSFGSSPLAGHPALGPLMPAPMVSRLVSGPHVHPELLLDLRSSPPG
jgi:hypothetical protein